jgi:hypothetical protein
MRRIGIIGWLFIIVACSSETSSIGTDFFSGGALDISYLDSVSVHLSTVKFDSLINSNTKRMMIGSHVDADLGRFTASSYFQIGLPQAIDLDEKKVSLEYAVIVLKYDGYSFYDTASTPVIANVHLLTEKMSPSDGNFYNVDKFDFNASPIGTVSFEPTPHRKDSVLITLTDAFAEDLFTKCINGSKEVKTNDDFVKYLPGITIQPDTTTSSAIVGFSSWELRLYYYDRSQSPSVEKHITFSNSSNSYYFTNIHNNRSQTLLKSLPPYKSKLSADSTSDRAYIQGGAGLAVRVDIPSLRSLAQYDNFFVNQAVLEIYTVKEFDEKNVTVPSSLLVYEVDKHNNLYSAKFKSTAVLKQDKDLGRDTRYALDITSFVKAQMKDYTVNENALLFFPEDAVFRGSATRVYLANPSYQYKTRLRIYFATMNNSD